MVNLDPAVTELMRYGVVGAFLIMSIAINVFLWRKLSESQKEKIRIMEKHEAEKVALYERTMVSRETLIDKYHEFVRTHDMTISELIRWAQSRGGAV